jgi:hypothetical protein
MRPQALAFRDMVQATEKLPKTVKNDYKASISSPDNPRATCLGTQHTIKKYKSRPGFMELV